CGAWLRIQHGLAEMEGGTLYGDVLGFYTRRLIAPASSPRRRAMKTENLSRADIKFIKDRVREVHPQLRDSFEKAYQAWKEACSHPLILISSNPAARTQNPEFLELISL